MNRRVVLVASPENGLVCSACRAQGLETPQVDTPSGASCKFGHGGAEGVPPRLGGTVTGRATSEQPAPANTPKSSADEPLHRKYRPRSLDTMLGQDEVVRSLEALLKLPTVPHAFLFTGPSGCGKTTLARIIANAVDCEPMNIIECDAATNTGIDAMRAITDGLRYMGFGAKPNKVIIIDEAHGLSKGAWTSLLKSVEEPPSHVWWMLCTTDDGKVPDTIKTRCVSYSLRPLRYGDIQALVEFVAAEERLTLVEGVVDLVIQSANGSPRYALQHLAKVSSCRNREEAARLLEATADEAEIIDFCRLLISGKLDWNRAQEVLRRLKEQNPEAVRITVVNYLNVCLLSSRDSREVPKLLDLLDAFTRPMMASDKLAPITLAVGTFLFPPQRG